LLTGEIGTGKSTLAIKAIEALRCHPSKSYRIVSASFCRGQAAHEAIIRGLLYGIAQRNQEALDVVVDCSYQDAHNHVKGQRNLNALKSLQTIWECLTKCVEIRKKELCFVIDGIDECDKEPRRELLKFFTKLVKDSPRTVSSPPVKILILSRPIRTIFTSLTSSKTIDLREVRDLSCSNETKRIIEGIVAEKRLIPLDDMLRTQTCYLLQQKADGVFSGSPLL
jgi:hypothetical protein